jgi:hypothetical protein
VEVGYLTPDSSLVVVDTMGRRTLFTAYRMLEREATLMFLGRPRPMEPLGEVRVSVWLHRRGYGRPGEPVLSPIPARLYRTSTSHVLVGGTARALRMPRRGSAAVVHHPYGSNLPDIDRSAGVVPPSKRAPAVLVVADASVKACQRVGRSVHLYGTEQKEFLDFVIGTLSATIDFPTEGAAEAFARDFPSVRDPRAVDPTITVDVDRSKRFVWSRRVLTAGKWYLLYLVLAESALVGAALRLGRFRPEHVGVIAAGLALAAFLFLPTYLRQFRREQLDLEGKWPRVALERWAREGPAHAGAFLRVAREIGVPLDPETEDVGPLDRFLREQPPNAYFRGFAMEAAAYLGEVALASMGRDVAHAWRYDPGHGDVVLEVPSVDYWVSPIVPIAKVWLGKDPKPLGAWAKEWTEDFRLRVAFQDAAAFAALGFPYGGWQDFEAFGARVRADLGPASPTTHVLQDRLFRVRTLSYGPFEIRVVDVEVEGRLGVEFLPVVAIPFAAAAPTRFARPEGASPRSPHREDIAFLRFEGCELEPLGVQVANYVETGPGFADSVRIELRLLAVADAGRVVGARMRGLTDAKDFLTPLERTPEGAPAGPYARVLGRIADVAEAVNPFGGSEVWRLDLDVSGFALRVHVRKDRCDGVPAAGHHFQGDLWLAGDVRPAKPAAAPYIR